MIYLKNTTDAQPLFIPRNGEDVAGDMILKMRNTTDNTEISVSVTDLHTSGLYFNLALTLPSGIAVGEYQYRLLAGELVMSDGIVYIGEFKNPSQYEETITYKQYESE